MFVANLEGASHRLDPMCSDTGCKSNLATVRNFNFFKKQLILLDATAGCQRHAGGAKEDRTPDLYNAIVALSQLSYGPMKERYRIAAQKSSKRSDIFLTS